MEPDERLEEWARSQDPDKIPPVDHLNRLTEIIGAAINFFTEQMREDGLVIPDGLLAIQLIMKYDYAEDRPPFLALATLPQDVRIANHLIEQGVEAIKLLPDPRNN